MKLELVAVSGKWKGYAWPVGDAPLTMGRGEDVTVQVAHRTVSRHHCEIRRDGDQVRFRDLGSRNPALVNGVPFREGVLSIGDELAVGPAIFVLTNSAYAGRRESPQPGDAETRSWADDAVLADTPSGDYSQEGGRPRTVDDLALLYNVSREFGRCLTTGELHTSLGRHLEARFHPSVWWLARVGGDGELLLDETAAPRSGERAAPPPALLQRCLRERRSLVGPPGGKPADSEEFLLAAPVYFAGVDLGVLALRRGASANGGQEGELVILTLLARSLAPFLYALENLEQLRRDHELFRSRAGESETLIGVSRAMAQVRKRIAEVAKSDLPVLISGETGTGKEVAARMLLARSARHARPFIVVNCAAIPRELFESELFGHEKGAYTGATEARSGLLEQADGGTLFLDEVGDLTLDNQARILRVAETGAFRRIGSGRESRVDVRVISATNKDLKDAIRSGAFREDLYHRLNGFEIHIPPLRERPSDIPVLTRHFFEMGRTQARIPLTDIGPGVFEYFGRYAWPGNVRELRSCMQRAIALARNPVIQLEDVLARSQYAVQWPGETGPSALREVERRHIEAVLAACEGDIQQTAKVLEIGRSTLYRKMETYGLKP
ncbi:MAG: sigma 54-interacting transcriptional regulator [Candidatus Hydrogenedentes bacterium]|nr:sigma 54-interacting transcriptional regulator [Candidatus Hydrogenedentota bacterium]